jgi:hypothetical protein
MQFGRKSEKLEWQIEQLELKLDEPEASRAESGAPSPTPTSVASNGAKKPGPGLLAHVLVSKYSGHLPRIARKRFTHAKVWSWIARR